jgi:hypothetical protein
LPAAHLCRVRVQVIAGSEVVKAVEKCGSSSGKTSCKITIANSGIAE